MKFRKLIILILILSSSLISFSQVSEDQLKLQYTYRFAENITWDEENLTDTFFLVYLGNTASFYKNFKLLEKKELQGRPIKTIECNDINNINLSRSNLIFVDNSQNENLELLFNKVLGKNILIVSDKYAIQQYVMINFIYPKKNKISFEINKKTIADQKLEIKPKLLLLGGNEIDIRELYKMQEKELDKERERVEVQKAEIEKLNANIIVKQTELKEKEKTLKAKEEELKIQTAKLNSQKLILNKIKKEVTNSKSLLLAKINDLRIKEDEIANQKNIITEQNKKVDDAKIELVAVSDEIAAKKKELKEKQIEISKKEKQLTIKDSTINAQKQWIIIGGIVLTIILILAILLVKMIKDRNLANRKLEYKNIEINNKNSEINTQKDELQLQKQYIEHQLKETNASINYALTIQNAILPLGTTISKYYQNFILFRPKDVVSGDFYWFTHLEAKNGLSAKTFIAAIDCTGHGVPGAFMSMIGNRLLNEIVNEKKITNTAEILEELNANVIKSLKQEKSDNKDGMDMCICKIEETQDNKTLVSFSGAKRPLYYYNSKTQEIEIKEGDRKSIGGAVHRKSNKIKFGVTEILTSKNDVIYLSTDGYLDQNDVNRKRFGKAKFLKTVETIAKHNMIEQKNILDGELDKHQKGADQRDDITLIGIKF